MQRVGGCRGAYIKLRRLIFLCGGATATRRFTRQICDHKMADTKSNMVHRKTSGIIIGTFIGSEEQQSYREIEKNEIERKKGEKKTERRENESTEGLSARGRKRKNVWAIWQEQ